MMSARVLENCGRHFSMFSDILLTEQLIHYSRNEMGDLLDQ